METTVSGEPAYSVTESLSSLVHAKSAQSPNIGQSRWRHSLCFSGFAGNLLTSNEARSLSIWRFWDTHYLTPRSSYRIQRSEFAMMPVLQKGYWTDKTTARLQCWSSVTVPSSFTRASTFATAFPAWNPLGPCADMEMGTRTKPSIQPLTA